MNAQRVIKIITLGPATRGQSLQKLKAKGVDFVRNNMSHSSLEDLVYFMRLAREADIPFIVDTEGSQIRTGEFESGGVHYDEGQRIRLHSGSVVGSPERLSLTPGFVIDQFEVGDVVHIAGTQLLILGTFTLLMGPQYYLLFWLLPIVTIAKGIGFLRILAEHSDPNHSIVYRSFSTGIVRRNLLGPFGFAHHAEHHDYMSIPYPRLGSVFRKRLESRGGARREHDLAGEYQVYAGSHLALIARWLFVELPVKHVEGPRD